jgi:hypothetical protein
MAAIGSSGGGCSAIGSNAIEPCVAFQTRIKHSFRTGVHELGDASGGLAGCKGAMAVDFALAKAENDPAKPYRTLMGH